MSNMDDGVCDIICSDGEPWTTLPLEVIKAFSTCFSNKTTVVDPCSNND